MTGGAWPEVSSSGSFDPSVVCGILSLPPVFSVGSQKAKHLKGCGAKLQGLNRTRVRHDSQLPSLRKQPRLLHLVGIPEAHLRPESVREIRGAFAPTLPDVE